MEQQGTLAPATPDSRKRHCSTKCDTNTRFYRNALQACAPMTTAYENILRTRQTAVPFLGGATQPSTSCPVDPGGERERLNQHPRVGTRP